MDIKKKLVISAGIAIIPLILSNITSITPCKTSLSIPNADTYWKFCKLNFDIPNTFEGIKQLFFGFTSNPFIADLTIFLFFFAVSMLFFYYFKKK